MTAPDLDEFDRTFQRFADSPTSTAAFRWEGLQHYHVDYDEPSWRAHQDGTSWPERSIRTDGWLARIARSTLAGKEWTRVRHIVEPLTEYTRWELVAYGESAPVGEQIFVVRDLPASVASLPDFWVFDGATAADQVAITMYYGNGGELVDFEMCARADELAALRAAADDYRRLAEPLNDYLAHRRAKELGDS